MSNEATDGLAPSVFAIFRAQLERILAFFRQRAKTTRGQKPRVRIRVGLPRPGVPGRGHCRLKFQHGFRFFSRILHKVVLFWQPQSYFSPWSPPSFVVDDVPYSCAEQYMMAAKTRPFKTIEQRSSSCCRLVQAHANASVEAGATLTPVLGTGRSKTPCYLAPTPNSRRTQP